MALKYKKNYNSIIVDDPIYGKVTVPYPFSKIVLTKEMLRLEKISQNGFSQYEFSDLENNDRLSHSVGAFYVMSLILERLETVLSNYNISISDDDKDIALCSMLLHDIGHGPFSHSLEVVTNYSHEKRTTDIILGDTEVGKLLLELFGIQKVKQIASFIAEINNKDDLGKDSFTKLLKNLVSNQLDADRLDYLVRDAYYMNMPSGIDLDLIISNLNVIVDSNQEYALLIDRKGLSSVENVLIQRYQMYRDVYLSPLPMLSEFLFKHLLDKYKNNSILKNLPVSKYFKILAEDNSISNLSDFIQMVDSDFKESFEVLMENDVDPIVAYLSNYKNLSDYILIENNISVRKIQNYLTEIFGDIDLSNSLSVINIKTKRELYKKDQILNIKCGNRILDLLECTSLIQSDEFFENIYTFFNPTMLKLELGMTDEQFNKYINKIDKIIDLLNKKPEEFELKYIIKDCDDSDLLETIIDLFLSNGFKIISRVNKENYDDYFDTPDLQIYHSGGSLRIRKETKDSQVKYKGTYKIPLGEGEVYSSRTEIEDILQTSDFNEFVKHMKDNNIEIDFSKIIDKPILNCTTNRTDILLEKNSVRVCLSLDKTIYTNYFLDDIKVIDGMVEIEAVGEINNRIILNEIHKFINEGLNNLFVNKQSKYERGINSTLTIYNCKQNEVQNIDSILNPSVHILKKKLKNSKN